MFFVLSKVAEWLLAPLNGLILLLAIGLLLAWTRRRRAGMWIISLVTACFFAIAFTPLADFALHPLEHRIAPPQRLPEKLDGIILIGSAQSTELTEAYGTPHMQSNAETMTTFVALARRYPQAKRVFAGGSGRIFPGRNHSSSDFDPPKHTEFLFDWHKTTQKNRTDGIKARDF